MSDQIPSNAGEPRPRFTATVVAPTALQILYPLISQKYRVQEAGKAKVQLM
ncbi:hypothetical protein DPMN_177202 [Dreissena polymorpha]|uniref:Uncharacterized protein n=1 Tax=Dreissena polymorpha TaxID=45954 RepID=A0A9D4E8C7_DREPO|nr:hypothetical protein DPMN_177202 [Dreissena polymorpha]